ncbi:MAG: MFS transporter [Candidatus Colwellbacteria bacterium]
MPISKKERLLEGRILDENPDVTTSKLPDWARRIPSAFPALQARNFRLYFIGQFISVSGTWIHMVAQGWLALQLTNSPFLVGLVAAALTLPSLLFSLHAGALIDRFPKKKILIFTQATSGVIVLILALLTFSDNINITGLVIFAFLLGSINSIDLPARQAFVPDLVKKKILSSAIALNSGMFNAARVIGPSVAGILIAFAGVGGAFLFNGITYFAAVIILLFVKGKIVSSKISQMSMWPAIKEGIRYAVSHPAIRALMILAALSSFFGQSYVAILPVVAKNTFNLDATGLGYLYAAGAMGAVVASILISLYTEKVRSAWFIVGGNTLFAMGLILFSFASSILYALIFLFITGLGLLMQIATMNTIVQNAVYDEIRGRIMSIYLLMFLGTLPLGNLQIGYLAERLGVDLAIRLNAIILLLVGIIAFVYRNKIREEIKKYSKQKRVKLNLTV